MKITKEQYLKAEKEINEKFKYAMFEDSIKLLEKQKNKLDELYFKGGLKNEKDKYRNRII